MRGQRHAPAALCPRERPGTHCTGGWPVWTGAENLAPTGIRSPDRPARSQSLYQLSYPAHVRTLTVSLITRKEKEMVPFGAQICVTHLKKKPFILLHVELLLAKLRTVHPQFLFLSFFLSFFIDRQPASYGKLAHAQRHETNKLRTL